MDWQPIASAPKDGTQILGVQFKSYYGGGRFVDGAVMMWEGGSVLQGMWAYPGRIVSSVPDEYEPTHWLPIPPPLA